MSVHEVACAVAAAVKCTEAAAAAAREIPHSIPRQRRSCRGRYTTGIRMTSAAADDTTTGAVVMMGSVRVTAVATAAAAGGQNRPGLYAGG